MPLGRTLKHGKNANFDVMCILPQFFLNQREREAERERVGLRTQESGFES